jgi:hypothetical protein
MMLYNLVKIVKSTAVFTFYLVMHKSTTVTILYPATVQTPVATAKDTAVKTPTQTNAIPTEPIKEAKQPQPTTPSKPIEVESPINAKSAQDGIVKETLKAVESPSASPAHTESIKIMGSKIADTGDSGAKSMTRSESLLSSERSADEELYKITKPEKH